MIFIDSHTHLNDPELYSFLEEEISYSRENNLKFILVASYDLESAKRAILISQKYPECHAAIGLHPENMQEAKEGDWDEIKSLMQDKNCVAIGETGLDYHWVKDLKEREKQKRLFIEHIELANKLHLPLTIHSRDAAQDTYQILSQHVPEQGAILHCYSYSVEMMELFLKLPLWFGFGGTLTFKNAKLVKEVLSSCPLERVVTETDAPYLTPEPFRGKRNEPKNVIYVAKKIAEITSLPLEEVTKQIAKNIEKIFHVKLL